MGGRKQTFQNVVDVVLVVVDTLKVIQVAGKVSKAILEDEDLGIVETCLDPVQSFAHPVRSCWPSSARPNQQNRFKLTDPMLYEINNQTDV